MDTLTLSIAHGLSQIVFAVAGSVAVLTIAWSLYDLVRALKQGINIRED